MEKFGLFIANWWALILLLCFIGWIVYLIKSAKYWNEDYNHYYTKDDIYLDKDGNEVVTFMSGEDTHTFIHMHKKYLKKK